MKDEDAAVVAEAIEAARSILAAPGWTSWAERWLSGRDRSQATAVEMLAAAHEAAESAKKVAAEHKDDDADPEGKEARIHWMAAFAGALACAAAASMAADPPDRENARGAASAALAAVRRALEEGGITEQ